jgi:EpsI family protein
MPLGDAIPADVEGFVAEDVQFSQAEQDVAGMSSYVLRAYRAGDAAGSLGFSLYVGYYDSQTQGKTIHSPRNCLPGGGWEPLSSTVATLATAGGTVVVNRYVIQNGDERALVLYWYQGRGRVAANEYRVKWDLLRDAALKGRTEEALVRIIVPIRTSETESFELASRAARAVMPAVQRALPEA